MNSSRFMTPQQYDYVKRICDVRRSYYNFWIANTNTIVIFLMIEQPAQYG
jgi:hypothetical protein